MLQPKRLKYRKMMKGRNRGLAQRGSKVSFGEFALKATDRGRIIYGVFIGLMIYVIRTWGGYPDAVAFAVLLANICVPLIDYYTQPKVYGEKD